MVATVQSIPASSCGHRSIVFDVVGVGTRTLSLHASEIADTKPETFDELRDAAIIILRHQYLSRRAAGGTVAQALADLIGFTVRI